MPQNVRTESHKGKARIPTRQDTGLSIKVKNPNKTGYWPINQGKNPNKIDHRRIQSSLTPIKTFLNPKPTGQGPRKPRSADIVQWNAGFGRWHTLVKPASDCAATRFYLDYAGFQIHGKPKLGNPREPVISAWMPKSSVQGRQSIRLGSA